MGRNASLEFGITLQSEMMKLSVYGFLVIILKKNSSGFENGYGNDLIDGVIAY